MAAFHFPLMSFAIRLSLFGKLVDELMKRSGNVFDEHMLFSCLGSEQLSRVTNARPGTFCFDVSKGPMLWLSFFSTFIFTFTSTFVFIFTRTDNHRDNSIRQSHHSDIAEPEKPHHTVGEVSEVNG